MSKRFLAVTLLSSLGLFACGGGGSGASGTPSPVPTPPTNSAPMADAGADRTVAELSPVNLDGSGSSDADGDTLAYAWTQIAGPLVTLADASLISAGFTAPDVDATTVLTFQLEVSDGTDSNTDFIDVTVEESLNAVTVAGKVEFEWVNPNVNCRGLDLDNPETRPIRGATVQLLDASDSTNVLASMPSGADGSYSFANITANSDVRIRVRAELISNGPASWDVEIRDNVDTSANPPPLGERPLYVVDFPVFSSGTTDIDDANFVATTGWGTNAYTGPRLAAPFAILDAIMDGMEMITAVDPTADFPPLDAFWSVNNKRVSPSDIDNGELSTSFYSSSLDSLFLLGDAATDTEEFDDHVSIHEWGHYFEDNFSRSDSIGGAHSIGQTLDPRLAFGEGFATALAAIALEEPIYCDTSAPLLTSGFSLDTENENRGPQGFYNEMSVATLLHDLWDTAVDGSDSGSVGFGPIYEVMTGPQASTEAFTTLFSFATELRNVVQTADLPFVDSQLARENIDVAGLNIYGDNQLTFPQGSRDVSPVYTDLPIDGSTINICTNSDFDSERDGNRLSEHRYLRFRSTSSSTYEVTVVPNPVPAATMDPPPAPPDQLKDFSDPDVFIYLNGMLVAVGGSEEENRENFTTQLLPAGSYAVAINEFRFSDEDNTPSDYPQQVCFDVTMSP